MCLGSMRYSQVRLVGFPEHLLRTSEYLEFGLLKTLSIPGYKGEGRER